MSNAVIKKLEEIVKGAATQKVAYGNKVSTLGAPDLPVSVGVRFVKYELALLKGEAVAEKAPETKEPSKL